MNAQAFSFRVPVVTAGLRFAALLACTSLPNTVAQSPIIAPVKVVIA